MNQAKPSINYQEILDQIQLPRDVFHVATKFYADRVAFVDGSRSMAYGQLDQRVAQLAGALSASGIHKNDVVATILPTCQEHFEILFACYETGVIITGFGRKWLAEPMIDMLRQTQAKLLIYDPQVNQAEVEKVKQALPELRSLATGQGGEYEQFLENASPLSIATTIDPEAIASYSLTSGTTGQPKIVPTSHKIWITTFKMITESYIKGDQGLPEIMRYLFSLSVLMQGSQAVLPLTIAGATMVLFPDWDPEKALGIIEKEQITDMFLTPSQYIDLLDCELGQHNLSSLRLAIYGSAPFAVAKLKEALQKIPAQFQGGTGLAECLGPIAGLSAKEHRVNGQLAPDEILATVGFPHPKVSIKILDEDNQPVPEGEIGRVVVKAPQVFGGYLNRPDLNAKVLRDGWFYTDDLGRFDKTSRLQLLCRQSDVIVKNGKTLYPYFQEELLHQHPAVKECVVIDTGGRVVAAVSLRKQFKTQIGDANLTQEILDFVNQKLEPWQAIDLIKLFDELPRGEDHKVLRKKIKELV